MSRKPFEIYTTNDWGFLAQSKIEGQWFERKAHPPSHPPRGLQDFVHERIARTVCGFANSNPDVGGLLVIGIGDAGELHGLDRHGTDYGNTLRSYADFLDGPTPEHKLVDCTRNDGAPDQLIFIYTQEVRKASLVAVEDAPSRRLERVHQIAQTLATRVFPLVIGPHEIQLATAPAEINQPPFLMGQELREPKAQFDNRGLRQDDDILRGLTTFGSFQKPQNAFRLFDASPKGDGIAARGTWVMLFPNRFMLATSGPNPLGQTYQGTPRPLEIAVHRISTRGKLDLAIYAQHALSLTRLNWASTRAFCHAPITIKFAQDIAYLMNVFLATGADFRVHERLRHTPWFL